MWWLIGRNSAVESDSNERGRCPYCNQITSCKKITKKNSTNVWFVPVSENEDIDYICLRCGGQFKSFALTPEEEESANEFISGCFIEIFGFIFVIIVSCLIFGFHAWSIFGIPIIYVLIRFIFKSNLRKNKNNKDDPRVSKKKLRPQTIMGQYIKSKSWVNYDFPTGNTADDIVDRNLIGMELEKADEVDRAIELYEQNVFLKFDGSRPYTRLAIIYRRRKQYSDEIRVIEKAISVFKKQNAPTDLEYFSKRLVKVKKILLKRLLEQLKELGSRKG